MKTLKLLSLFSILSLGACVSQTATPMSKNSLQVNISSPYDMRATAIHEAYKKAAQATLDRHHDLFIITAVNGYTDSSLLGGGFNSLGLQPTQLTGAGGFGIATIHTAEVSLTIKMFNYGDKGADNALDAREELK